MNPSGDQDPRRASPDREESLTREVPGAFAAPMAVVEPAVARDVLDQIPDAVRCVTKVQWHHRISELGFGRHVAEAADDCLHGFGR
jgi:hypothetical protein